MSILSLDISAKSTGYAVMDADKIIRVSHISLSYPSHPEALVAFEVALTTIINIHKPTQIIIEDIFKGPSAKVFKILSLYHGIAYKVTWDYLQADPVLVYPSAVRSTLSRAYNVKLTDKESVFNFIKDKYHLLDWSFKSHNDLTDAIALGLAQHATERTVMAQDRF